VAAVLKAAKAGFMAQYSIFEDFGYLRKKAAHGDMSRLGGRGILIF
jgi:hypothetical protein